jgi:hypothetical protein
MPPRKPIAANRMPKSANKGAKIWLVFLKGSENKRTVVAKNRQTAIAIITHDMI